MIEMETNEAAPNFTFPYAVSPGAATLELLDCPLKQEPMKFPTLNQLVGSTPSYKEIYEFYVSRLSVEELAMISEEAGGRLFKRDVAYARIACIYYHSGFQGDPFLVAASMQRAGTDFHVVIRNQKGVFRFLCKGCFSIPRKSLKVRVLPKPRVTGASLLRPDPVEYKTFKPKQKYFSPLSLDLVRGKKGGGKNKGKKITWHRVPGSFGSSH